MKGNIANALIVYIAYILYNIKKRKIRTGVNHFAFPLGGGGDVSLVLMKKSSNA